MAKAKPKVRRLTLDPNPEGKSKRLGGADYDDWNDWLASAVSSALPVNQEDDAAASRAATAVFSGIINIGPADPIEGILVSQLMAANQASLSMYQRAWAQPSEYFEARTKYLALADKAARTVALLTERLDHHRGRGQQKIVVQHVTTLDVRLWHKADIRCAATICPLAFTKDQHQRIGFGACQFMPTDRVFGFWLSSLPVFSEPQ
jgi:hypothetical protein